MLFGGDRSDNQILFFATAITRRPEVLPPMFWPPNMLCEELVALNYTGTGGARHLGLLNRIDPSKQASKQNSPSRLTSAGIPYI